MLLLVFKEATIQAALTSSFFIQYHLGFPIFATYFLLKAPQKIYYQLLKSWRFGRKLRNP